MRRIAFAILAVVVLAAWWITAPSALTASDLPEHEPDAHAPVRKGFWVSHIGCWRAYLLGRRLRRVSREW